MYKTAQIASTKKDNNACLIAITIMLYDHMGQRSTPLRRTQKAYDTRLYLGEQNKKIYSSKTA